ncbi:nuclear transport factor 2 family protein [Spirosoma radiotolerans]|uniref:SnoaL-like domain-containing protein n=1 Tax=Spirosoma radiotolerans TaxID=1379870 RepID=A0A0E3ZVJ8_9BACT|nr:nuclear transport factor 2 family protein [Spirosoma radiotolerans]AKD55145.1 hypothetical protein SD10_09730 [Spirosoma radiotolerans]
MTIDELADRLVTLCREGNYEQAQRELYSNDAKSIEPTSAQGMPSVQGLDAIIAKGNQFQRMIQEIHGGHVGGPLIAGNTIAITISLDATFTDGTRQTINELAVYTVQNGKIIEEQFFY